MSSKTEEHLPAIAGLSSRLEILENLFDKDSTTLKYANQNLRDACAEIEKIQDYLKEIKLVYSNPLQQEVWQQNITERLEKLEYFFSGKIKNPIYEAIEAHIENFNKRIEKLENGSLPQGNHIRGIECECRIDNRAHQINTKAVLNDLWTRQKLLEDYQNDKLSTEAFGTLLERIEKLESNQLGQHLDPKVWVFVNERLDKVESKTMLMINVEEHLKQWKWVQEQISRIDMMLQSTIKPHKCPVCDGEGLDKSRLVMDAIVEQPSTFNMKNPDCKSCEGKGIVWG